MINARKFVISVRLQSETNALYREILDDFDIHESNSKSVVIFHFNHDVFRHQATFYGQERNTDYDGDDEYQDFPVSKGEDDQRTKHADNGSPRLRQQGRECHQDDHRQESIPEPPSRFHVELLQRKQDSEHRHDPNGIRRDFLEHRST